MNPELIDVLNIEDFPTKRDYGRERGLFVSPTEAEARQVDKINEKINANASSKAIKEEDEEYLVFDLMSKPRILQFEGSLLKRSSNSILQHHSKRHGYLFNDVLLITTSTTTTNQMSIRDLKLIDENEDNLAFELICNDRSHILLAESEQDKRIWMEEITTSIFCILSSVGKRKLGWFHEVVRGTFHSCAYYGEYGHLQKHIARLSGGSVDIADESGMTPLHWATLNGHFECVRLLLEAGSNIDILNNGLNSPLLIASACGYQTIIFLLLDHQADIHLRNLKDYDCLLMLLLFGALSYNVEEIINAFKVRGIDLNKQDINGVAPLHECAARNLPLSIQSLVDAGVDVNVKHGRNGLTPLQLACSNREPDAVTIRSLLDRGALPNWKDVNKMTAFDLIIQASRKSLELVRNNDTSNPIGLQQTLDQAGDFIQMCLPTLKELTRKGARYAPEALTMFRESFLESIKSGAEQWKQATEPENFPQYATYKGESYFRPKNWLSDSASAHCLLCLEKFTYSNRRHHCRTCGTLCCDLCSSKKLLLNFGATSPTTTTSSGKNSKSEGPDRVCDSCFNKYVYEASQWTSAMNQARKEQLKLEQAMLAASHKKSAGGKTASHTGSKIDQSPMNEAMRALEERGQKLQEVAEKSEALREGAGEFNKMTKQLLQQQQQHVLYKSNNSQASQTLTQDKKKK